ncbi:MAG: tyrosine-type recombinase/integrase, partial [Phycisphaerales bacterium]|nr:tyrosine-type recombinase/integrase [Phycisphaerales bacterium]
TTLGALLATYFNHLAVKSGTETCYKQARRSLEEHFGKDRPLNRITTLDAEQWRQAMKREGLAEATISKRVKVARQAFRRGMKWRMVTENPFSEVKAGVQSNRSRMFFVTREMAEAVLDACPDLEWRVLFVLARYGGLRTPSETLRLRWSDIDWAKGRMVVWSPKTEGHEGREFRQVPLFPELKTLLLELFEQAEPGAEFVITRYRSAESNLRTQLLRVIARAGLSPWPKAWQNLRSSRQTELAEEHPLHVVCSWIGNSVVIAQRHYVQVTDAHFAKAIAGSSSIKPAQKAAQHDAELARTEPQRALGQVA